MTTLADRLKMARTEAGLSQHELAAMAKVSQSTIANIESGRNSGSKHIVEIARALSTNVRWLLDGELPRLAVLLSDWPAAAAKFSSLRDTSSFVVDKDTNQMWADLCDYTVDASTGEVIWTTQEPRALPILRTYLSKFRVDLDDCKLVLQRGDSMEPLLFNQDVALIDTAQTAPREAGVFAVFFEGEALIRTIYKQSGGGLTLHAFNPKYPDKTIPADQVANLRIIGLMVYRAGRGMDV